MTQGTERSTAEELGVAIKSMTVVLRNENALLRGLLNETEKITRQTVKAEVESKNNKLLQGELTQEIASLRKRIKSAEKEKQSLEARRDEARRKNQELDTENAALKKTAAALDAKAAKLKSVNTGLKKDLARLEAKRDKLQEDVTRLKDLRAKYLAEIAAFRKEEEEE